MKKYYIKPNIGKAFMETAALMVASVGHTEDTEAAQNINGETVNFSRQGSFWDDAE